MYTENGEYMDRIREAGKIDWTYERVCKFIEDATTLVCFETTDTAKQWLTYRLGVICEALHFSGAFADDRQCDFSVSGVENYEITYRVTFRLVGASEDNGYMITVRVMDDSVKSSLREDVGRIAVVMSEVDRDVFRQSLEKLKTLIPDSCGTAPCSGPGPVSLESMGENKMNRDGNRRVIGVFEHKGAEDKDGVYSETNDLIGFIGFDTEEDAVGAILAMSKAKSTYPTNAFLNLVGTGLTAFYPPDKKVLAEHEVLSSFREVSDPDEELRHSEEDALLDGSEPFHPQGKGERMASSGKLYELSGEELLGDLVKVLDSDGVDLNRHDDVFIYEMVDWVVKGNGLTENQSDKLEGIWKKRIGNG